MSNFENNILDGEELIQNAPFQSSFSARWTKVERILYPVHIVILILFLVFCTIFFLNTFPKNHIVYDIEVLGSIVIILPVLLPPIIYIYQFRKLRKRYLSHNLTNNNRRLTFLMTTCMLLLVSIIFVLFLSTLIYLSVYFSFDAKGTNATIIGYTLMISIPLFILNSFLSAYYIYSIRFVYSINKTPIDDILN